MLCFVGVCETHTTCAPVIRQAQTTARLAHRRHCCRHAREKETQVAREVGEL